MAMNQKGRIIFSAEFTGLKQYIENVAVFISKFGNRRLEMNQANLEKRIRILTQLNVDTTEERKALKSLKEFNEAHKNDKIISEIE